MKKALDDLKEGETSDVIETDSALYIVRLDSETDARLSKYCQEHGLSKVEAIRQGVLLLLEKQK